METTTITKSKHEMEQESKFLIFFFTHKLLQVMEEFDNSKLQFKNPERYRFLLN